MNHPDPYREHVEKRLAEEPPCPCCGKHEDHYVGPFPDVPGFYSCEPLKGKP